MCRKVFKIPSWSEIHGLFLVQITLILFFQFLLCASFFAQAKDVSGSEASDKSVVNNISSLPQTSVCVGFLEHQQSNEIPDSQAGPSEKMQHIDVGRMIHLVLRYGPIAGYKRIQAERLSSSQELQVLRAETQAKAMELYELLLIQIDQSRQMAFAIPTNWLDNIKSDIMLKSQQVMNAQQAQLFIQEIYSQIEQLRNQVFALNVINQSFIELKSKILNEIDEQKNKAQDKAVKLALGKYLQKIINEIDHASSYEALEQIALKVRTYLKDFEG